MSDPNFVATGFRLWGWFDDADQTEAGYEPPHDAPCPYCFVPINRDDVRTHNLMWKAREYAKRSYFYRTHRTCDDAAKVRGVVNGSAESMDGRILDAIAKTGD